MPNIPTVANQRVISIGSMKDNRKALCDTDNIYAKINKEALFNVMKDLSPVNFQVWLYLASQRENYTFPFYPSYVELETGIKKSSLQEGIRVLIDKGYLIQRENSNIFDFYEVKRVKEEAEECMLINVHKDNDNQESKKEGFIF